ncbi:MAG: undecaprenyl-diphosphate phosphatase [Candidatus Moduliflexus flocculans]|nr:undecaprenyl-diphosphate phosphatase [Candidatus Moduliflexus flocculans]
MSSSAHLILARALLGWDADRARPRASTWRATSARSGPCVAYFRADLVGAGRRGAGPVPAGPSGPPTRPAGGCGSSPSARVPVVIVGVLLAGAIEDTPADAVGDRRHARRGRGRCSSWWSGPAARRAARRPSTPAAALAIGAAQAAALVPGVSRSGATITTGMFLGHAARGGGAVLVPARRAGHPRGRGARGPAARPGRASGAEQAWLFLIGMGVSGVVGYVTIKSLPEVPRQPLAGAVRVVPHRPRGGDGRPGCCPGRG